MAAPAEIRIVSNNEGIIQARYEYLRRYPKDADRETFLQNKRIQEAGIERYGSRSVYNLLLPDTTVFTVADSLFRENRIRTIRQLAQTTIDNPLIQDLRNVAVTELCSLEMVHITPT